ncbi:MAG: hypothetical protein L7F78_19070 [Syntrophales bacterium LBB04]|nr:hypothetical protein [Syntrophales bacterium LBB04]
MKYPKCQTENPDGMKFRGECGQGLRTTSCNIVFDFLICHARYQTVNKEKIA